MRTLARRSRRAGLLAILLIALALIALVSSAASLAGTAEAAGCKPTAELCTDQNGFVSYPIARLPGDQSDCAWNLGVDFGDGTSAVYHFSGTPFTISHTYPRPGAYTVHGTATNGQSPSKKWTCPSYSIAISVEYPLGEPCGPEAGETIVGTAGHDRISGSAGGDLIKGEAGDDVIDAAAGNDCLEGGDGLDWLKGGPGADKLDGGVEADLLDGKEGEDVLEGGEGNDFVSGGGGRDTVAGGNGDDILSDGKGANTYFGGPGNDVVSARQSIAERINCGPGADVAYVDVKDKTVGCEDVREEGAPSLGWPDNLDRGEDSGRAPSLSAEDARTLQGGVRDFARKWAPLVYLYPGERYLPEVANDYIGMASLRFMHEACFSDEVKRQGTVDPFKLSARAWHPDSEWTKTPYYHRRLRSACLGHHGRGYSTAEHTRPHDDGVFGKALPLTGEGFYLDIPDTSLARTGRDPGRVPVYYECCFRIAGGGWAVTYWFFYAYDSKSVASGFATQKHEADWERISIRFDAEAAPRSVAFFAHDKAGGYEPQDPGNRKYPGYLEVPWSSVQRVAGHPVVYSAEGSHASYPYAGTWELNGVGNWFADDYAGSGLTWQTWKNLSNARGQAWWGYGGAWGQYARIGFNSGPLGPGWKFPYPEAWSYR